MAHFVPGDARFGAGAIGRRGSGLVGLLPRFAILFSLGLMVALAPGLPTRTQTIAELLFWVALPLLMIIVRVLRG